MKFAGYVVGHTDALGAWANGMMYPNTHEDPNTILMFYTDPEEAIKAAKGVEGREYGGVSTIFTHDGSSPELFPADSKMLVSYANPEFGILELGVHLSATEGDWTPVIEVPRRHKRAMLMDLEIMKSYFSVGRKYGDEDPKYGEVNG